MRRLILGAGLAAAIALLAGCASSSTDTTTTSAATATTTVKPTSTTPATLSLERAARRYLEIVRPYNEALEDLERAVNSGEPLDTLTALAEATAAANGAQIKQLKVTPWPADVQTPVDGLIDESKQAQRYWEQAAQASTRDGLIEAIVAAGEHDGTAAASAIRELLNLKAYNENDYSG
jgi:ABC-type glycerol-3-phosphate transport system substrate-binding protein